MAIEIVSLTAFQTRAAKYFAAERPFVVRGLPLPADLYPTTLRLLRTEKLNLFNLMGTEPHELRSYHELLTAIDALHTALAQAPDPRLLWQTYGRRFANYVIRSDQVDPGRDFNLQVDVLPGTALSQAVVFPATRSYSDGLRPQIARQYLNTVLNISCTQQPLRNQKKNIHGHNYDTFSMFIQAEGPGAVYFFPPADYLRFRTQWVVARPGILLLIPRTETLSAQVFEQAEVFSGLTSGDLVYTPPFWFHCFEHAHSYLNVANGEFFPTLHARRLRQINADVFGADAEHLRWHAAQLPHYQP